MSKKTTAKARSHPPPMTVYDGTTALGELLDYGSEVEAFVFRGDEGRVKIGFFADRRSAMRAVSDWAKRER